MPEKLLTLTELAHYLHVSEEQITPLVEAGVIPAYKIADTFLRFRKEQIDAIRDEILAKIGTPSNEPHKAAAHIPAQAAEDVVLSNSAFDKIKDFFYFNDFYLISILIIAALLYYIFSM